MIQAHVVESAPVWVPGPSQVEESAIVRFSRWCGRTGATDGVLDFPSLHEWSVRDLEGFWSAVWTYYDVQSSSEPTAVVTEDPMPRTRWFTGARLNYVDHVLRDRDPEAVAVVDAREPHPDATPPASLTWGELDRQVRALRLRLRELGVAAGDRVVGYVPNCPEAVVAFLATASLGAIWSSCGQEYSAAAALARFAQLDPKVIVTSNGYVYAGKVEDRTAEVEAIAAGLPNLIAVVVAERITGVIDVRVDVRQVSWRDAVRGDGPRESEHVDFNAPLWVLFSSGTTGKPKGIVHSHGGVVVEHLKALNLQLDLGPGDVFFWYTSPSWMVWNYLVSALMTGSSIVCFDGSPTFPVIDELWRLADRHGVTWLGTSPAFLMACEKAGIKPDKEHDLSRLRMLGSSGSNLPPGSSRWLSEQFGDRVQVMSTSGGTDVVSAFAGAVPTMPVWAGELSAPCLGVALDAWDHEGRSIRDAVGELVVTRPMPSMPIFFWGDDTGEQYRDAYFSHFPGVWRHGDWITMTGRGTVVVHGRSDSTLNRNGVRMGSADIYAVVDTLPEVRESLVIGIDRADGSYWMPLFVVLEDGIELDAGLRERIRAAIKTQASPRHVPDDVIVAPGVPHTRTGKKLEIPVKRLIDGASLTDVVDPQSVDDPDLLRWYAAIDIPHPERGWTGAAVTIPT